MTYKINLQDADVLHMDESTGAITLDRSKLPESVVRDDIIMIHYIEDEPQVSHEYKVMQDDKENLVVVLDWIKQHGVHSLVEVNLNKKLDKAAKIQSAALSKKVKAIKSVIAQEISSRGGDYSFYIPDKDGTYPENPVSHKDAIKIYNDEISANDGEITPRVANAIVVDGKGQVIRRGLQKGYPGQEYTQGETPDEYFMMPFKPSTNSTKEDTKDEVTTTPDEDTTTSDAVSITKDQDQEEPKNETPDKSEDPKQPRVRATAKIINKFKNLLTVLPDIQLYDSEGKVVKNPDINTKNVSKFKVKARGNKMISLSKWLTGAQKAGLLKEDVLTEAPIKLSADELFDPDQISLSDIVKHDQAEKEAELQKQEILKKQQELKDKYEQRVDSVFNSITASSTPEDSLELLFDVLVPEQGMADTVAGEYVRAIMRLLYRDANDGDKFFEGYGLETCGGSAEYLYDTGFDEFIQSILDDSYRLADNDDAYTASLLKLTQAVLDDIRNNRELVYTPNDVDSRDYSAEYITENQPRYEIEIPGSDDIIQLVDNRVLDSWDLNSYVESQLEYDYRTSDATVARPWGHHDTSVTVENLTKDGYEYLHDMFENPDAFWSELVAEHADALESDEDFESDDDFEADDDIE